MVNGQPCRYYEKYKAKFKPQCNCAPCWKKWFDANPFLVATVAEILPTQQRLVINAYGDKYVKMLKKYIKGEL